ncbi:hypothetical protein B296_00011810 [Ensete ventricosum]|uniref:Uncharacterized protein n=1 Tax=Ensete ventricosum TaxID=4639 RepID=A0A427AV75_ENSVE|nr:hypothetical protein B296_00011810 [Ensete ventricosum]
MDLKKWDVGCSWATSSDGSRTNLSEDLREAAIGSGPLPKGHVEEIGSSYYGTSAPTGNVGARAKVGSIAAGGGLPASRDARGVVSNSRDSSRMEEVQPLLTSRDQRSRTPGSRLQEALQLWL